MDGIDRMILAEKLNIKPDFSEEEKDFLTTSYKEGKLNQYYNVVIEKVLDERKVKNEDKFSIYTGLLPFVTNLNNSFLINKDNDEDIIANAAMLYKMLMTEEFLPKLDNTKF